MGYVERMYLLMCFSHRNAVAHAKQNSNYNRKMSANNKYYFN
jgi:hypothetical protein